MKKQSDEEIESVISFNFFDKEKLLSNQYHNAFEITNNHLHELIDFSELKYDDIIQSQQKYIQSFDKDFQCLEEISMCIELIKNRKNQEIDFVSHYDTLITGFIKNLQIKKDGIENSVDFDDLILQEEKQISELKIMMDKFVMDTKESDLKTTYNTLLKTKDEIEISVMVNLCSLLIHSTTIDSRSVEKLLRNYGELKNRMINFSKSKLNKEEIIAIGNKIKLTVSKIDPNRSEDRILCTKYSHLLAFGLWGIAASEFLYCEFKKEELIIKSKKLKEEIIPIDLEIKHLENLKSKLNLTDQCKNENNELDSILLMFEEIKGMILNYAGKQYPEEIENKRMYFSRINSSLLMEEESILDLYSSFKSISKKYSKSSVQTSSIISNGNKPYLYLNGMCGLLNCLRRK